MLKAYWKDLGGAARLGLVAGGLLVLGMTIGAATWLLRTEREVLFTGLSAPDAAVMTAELDRMKLPYQLGTDGTSILVDRATVHHTRLKLLGKDLPLHGTVGFELFNNSDFGMTEFAQKINYQRALQGEITRTILSLSEIETARVHLALPEEGLFRRESVRAKASVTLGLRRNRSLSPAQVNGIQRLIAAAVPGVAAQDVTIVDAQGVALTRAHRPDEPMDSGSRLELKREVEQHLVRKAEAVLERAFGVGQAIASVDATLNMSQVRVTTEDLTTPAGRKNEIPTGVIVRERESSRDQGGSSARRDATPAGMGSSHRETDYQVGRRVEQVVDQPGSIERLQVVAVLKLPLKASQMDHARELLAAAVGLRPQRGDVIVVHSAEALMPTAAPLPATGSELPRAAAAGIAPAAAESTHADPGAVDATVSNRLLASLAGIFLLACVGAWLALRWLLQPRPQPSAPMSKHQREQTLAQVRAWLAEGPTLNQPEHHHANDRVEPVRAGAGPITGAPS